MSAGLLLLCLLGAPAPGAPARLAWTGIVRGPLAPDDAAVLERLLIDEFDGYDSFRLVDASGDPLDPRLFAEDAATVAGLRDEGAQLFVEGKAARSLVKFDQAIAIFESRMLGFPDYELLHSLLTFKAAALLKSRKSTQALTTLKQLHALRKAPPDHLKSFSKKFVRLYRQALRSMGPTGRVTLGCERCELIVDGKPRGPGPLEIPRVRPGKHYVVARWNHGSRSVVLRVAPGREASANIEDEGPASDVRRALARTLIRRAQKSEVGEPIRRLCSMAQASDLLVTAVRQPLGGGAPFLVVGRYTAGGELKRVAGAAMAGTARGTEWAAAVRKLGAALFVDPQDGQWLVLEDGRVAPGRGLEDLLYRPGSAVPEAASTPIPRGQEASAEAFDFSAGHTTTSSVADAKPLTEKWWFWTAVGVVAAGALVTTGALVLGGSATTTEFQVELP